MTLGNVRVRAIVWVYNEIDILPWSIGHLLNSGIDVDILDNWSDDGSAELAHELERSYPGRVTALRWPEQRPTNTSWLEMLKVTQERAQFNRDVLGYDWIIHQDADEFSYSQHLAGEESLVDAITRIDAAGYTAIDHEMHIYAPIEQYDGSIDPELVFGALYDGHETKRAERLRELKIWKQPSGARVDLAHNGGHTVRFDGCKVAPEVFIKRHYPLRTPEHASRKIASRRSRWAKYDTDVLHWHTHLNDPRHYPVAGLTHRK